MCATDVCRQEVVKVRFESIDCVFGPGQLLTLAETARALPRLDVLFVSIDILSISQIRWGRRRRPLHLSDKVGQEETSSPLR